jgi:hypothetical protein
LPCAALIERSLSFSTNDTVVLLTPALAATSLMVGCFTAASGASVQ